MADYKSVYPVQDSTHVRATTIYGTIYWQYYATDPAISLTGTAVGTSWRSDSDIEQRFHIDLGSAKKIKRIYYENYHSNGTDVISGVKNFTFWGSNTSGSFTDLVYAHNTNWTQITTEQSSFARHVADSVPDPKYILVTNTTAYRYYAFKFADTDGYYGYMGVRRIELQTDPTILICPLPIFYNN